MSFREAQTEDRRLVILRLLAESNDYTANGYLLQSALMTFGHSVSVDRLRADLDWLSEQDLVTVETVADLYVARLTSRGGDVAEGRTVVAGVKRPRP